MPTMTGKPRKRPGSRHKDRNMVALDSETYRMLKELADHYERPASWQARILIREAYRALGPLPGKDETT